MGFIIVFDLDETLWDGDTLYKNIKDILSYYKSRGCKLYVASFHTDAHNVCKELHIDHYFDNIYYGRGKNKLEMIRDILDENYGAFESDVIFFDDNYENIHVVRNNSYVNAVLVGVYGVTWNDVMYNEDHDLYSWLTR
jgi:HAD superfamily phosphatase (TIGR01681 family)